MLFNSYTYGVFLPLVFVLYLALPLRGRQIMLLLASYVFYCWEKPIYGTLLAASTILDYTVGRLMVRTDVSWKRRLLLACSIVGNLSLLGFFKYADFFGANICGLGHLLGFETEWKMLNFILPVGISFYTFQTMSYTIQLYRRQIDVERNFITFALFVSFFPQLVAGPIERASHLLPQLKTLGRASTDDVAVGCRRIVIGLFRKLVIADRLAIVVDTVFANPDAYPTLTVWTAVFAFTGQIYFDFAGYADIAIGSARLFGVDIMENFNRPLLARSIADFWNRWHISLTSWFRDYVFQPLGGLRKGGWRALLNASVVLLLCGLWHGAQWHFIMWGAYHAVILSLYYLWRFGQKKMGIRKRHGTGTTLGLILSISLTFVVNCIGIIFFRAPDMPAVALIFRALAGRHAGAGQPIDWYVWPYLAIVGIWLVVEFCQEYLGLNERYARLPMPVRAVGLAVVVVSIMLGAVNLLAPYMYFQF